MSASTSTPTGTSTLGRWAPLAGVMAPLLWFFGVFIGESGDVPDDDATAEQILGYFQEDANSMLLGAVLFMAGTLFFSIFVAVLRSRWRAGAGAEDSSSLAFGAGMIGAAFLAATWAPQLGVGVALEDMGSPISASTAEAAWHMGTGFFVVGEMFIGLFLFATAAANSRVPVLPSWLAWLAVVIGIVAVIPPIGWAAVIFALPVWLLLATFFLMRGTPPAHV